MWCPGSACAGEHADPGRRSNREGNRCRAPAGIYGITTTTVAANFCSSHMVASRACATHDSYSLPVPAMGDPQPAHPTRQDRRCYAAAQTADYGISQRATGIGQANHPQKKKCRSLVFAGRSAARRMLGAALGPRVASYIAADARETDKRQRPRCGAGGSDVARPDGRARATGQRQSVPAADFSFDDARIGLSSS
jgi:hypothetical protein